MQKQKGSDGAFGASGLDEMMSQSNKFSSLKVAKLQMPKIDEPTITNQLMMQFEREIASEFHMDALKEQLMRSVVAVEAERENATEVQRDTDARTESSSATDDSGMDSVQQSSVEMSQQQNRGTTDASGWHVPPIEEKLDDIDAASESKVSQSLLISKIRFLRSELDEMEIQKLTLESTIERLKREIQINEECETIEERTEENLLNHARLASSDEEDDDEDENLLEEDEDSGALVLHGDDDDLSADDDDYDESNDHLSTSTSETNDNGVRGESSQTLAYRVIQKKQKLQTKFNEVKELMRKVHLTVEEYRQEKLRLAHLDVTHKMRKTHAEKWLEEAKQKEESVAVTLAQHKARVDDVQHEKEYLSDQLQFVETQTQYCQEILRQLVDILKGKQELPSGVHLSVSRSLQLYSQLKGVALSGGFNMRFLKEFLAQHDNVFGLVIPDFEEEVEDSV